MSENAQNRGLISHKSEHNPRIQVTKSFQLCKEELNILQKIQNMPIDVGPHHEPLGGDKVERVCDARVAQQRIKITES